MNRVIVACHAFGQSPKNFVKVTGLAALAYKLEALLYAPAGSWGGISPYSVDMDQINSFAARLKSRYEGQRIDLVGFSDGASFVAALAQTLKVNSVTIAAGVQQVPIKESMQNKVLLIGGSLDPFVSISSMEQWHKKYVEAGYAAGLTTLVGYTHRWYPETTAELERFLA